MQTYNPRMDEWTKLWTAALGSGGLVGALAALFLHQTPQWHPLPSAPVPATAAAAPVAPGPVPLDASQAERAQAFPTVREQVILLGQQLRRVEGQMAKQRAAYEKFVRVNTPFDLPAWHQRQKELAIEHAEFELQLAQANAEYERYLCKDGQLRPECWH